MTSIEKFNVIVDIGIRNAKVKISTIDGGVYYCKPLHFAEDEDDWAYSFFTPDYPTHYFILECNFITEIEEISEAEWQEHLKKVEDSRA